MRLHFGKKIGQSGYELALAVFFSFFLHAVVIALALILYSVVTPKINIPPFYEVKLVGLPAEMSPAPAAAPAPSPPRAETLPVREKAHQQVKKAAPKPAPATPKKGDMPELANKQAPQKPPARVQPEAPPQQAQPAQPAVSAPSSGKTGAATSVAVNIPSGLEKPEFSYYSDAVRRMIKDNWKHPAVPKDTKVKVEFTIRRSGLLDGDVRLIEASGNTQFDQAAIRAILASAPFPRFPEDFYKPSAVFSADLMPE
jgi:TonB family protein